MIVQINKQGEVVNKFNTIDEVRNTVGRVSRDVKKVVERTPGRHSAGGHFWVNVENGRTTPISVTKNGRVVRAFSKISHSEEFIGKRAECISMHVRGKAYSEGINGYTVKTISL